MDVKWTGLMDRVNGQLENRMSIYFVPLTLSINPVHYTSIKSSAFIVKERFPVADIPFRHSFLRR